EMKVDLDGALADYNRTIGMAMCNPTFSTFMGVYTDAREASINAAQSLFVGLPTRKGRKSRK
ncbi:MAG: hypothetical protein WBL39_13460, partial [Terrimicrobiaceae bacterium]